MQDKKFKLKHKYKYDLNFTLFFYFQTRIYLLLHDIFIRSNVRFGRHFVIRNPPRNASLTGKKKQKP